MLCGASMAFGLTEGGYNAAEIKLTQLGRRIVASEVEGDVPRARAEATIRPRMVREFFEKYDKAKFPQDKIAENVLFSIGLPKDRLANSVLLLKDLGKAAGFIRETTTGPYVALDRASHAQARPDGATVNVADAHTFAEVVESERPSPQAPIVVAAGKASVPVATNNKVFISHGKKGSVVAQIKELLVFGKLEPVVSVERESTAIPVPEKVFSDMRACAAGVIHVVSEKEMTDDAGIKHVHINENVLIEIGAAMALYGKRVILLVEKGLGLPSNLQGLYRCDYDGDKLDYEATMKLLKTFNQLFS
jgi:hypothetical protein